MIFMNMPGGLYNKVVASAVPVLQAVIPALAENALFQLKWKRARLQIPNALKFQFTRVDKQDDAPQSLRKVKDYVHRTTFLPVALEFGDQSIYGEELNWLWRCWHDSLHYLYDLEMGRDHELALASIHQHELRHALRHVGKSQQEAACMIMWYDTAGQTLYHDIHGEFPTDQREFVHDCINMGLEWVLGNGGKY